MSNGIILPFKDKKEGLKIDLDRLLKEGISAIMSRNKKEEECIYVDNDIIEILDREENMPSSQNIRDKRSNWEEGLNGNYNTKSLNYRRNTNPFVPHLSKVDPNEDESEELRYFKNAVRKTKLLSELSKVVEQALNSGIRINACYEGQESFSDVVISKMLLLRSTKDKKENIMSKLLVNGAFFDYGLLKDKQMNGVYDKSYSKVQLEIAKRMEELKKVGESAAKRGNVEDVGIDNKTFFIEFSEDSTVKPGKIAEGARKLGFNKGEIKLGSHIVKIGEGEFEFKSEKGGVRNYVDMSDNSAFNMIVHISIGKLEIILKQKDDLVEVKVKNKEMWEKLQESGGIIKDKCLLRGMKIKEAIKKGSFKRSGIFREGESMRKLTEIVLVISYHG